MSSSRRHSSGGNIYSKFVAHKLKQHATSNFFFHRANGSNTERVTVRPEVTLESIIPKKCFAAGLRLILHMQQAYLLHKIRPILPGNTGQFTDNGIKFEEAPEHPLLPCHLLLISPSSQFCGSRPDKQKV
jgi:hypothetical protein